MTGKHLFGCQRGEGCQRGAFSQSGMFGLGIQPKDKLSCLFNLISIQE